MKKFTQQYKETLRAGCLRERLDEEWAGSWSHCRRGQCIKQTGSGDIFLPLCLRHSSPSKGQAAPGDLGGPHPSPHPALRAFLPVLPTSMPSHGLPETGVHATISGVQLHLSWACFHRPAVQLVKHTHPTSVTLCHTPPSCGTQASSPSKQVMVVLSQGTEHFLSKYSLTQ